METRRNARRYTRFPGDPLDVAIIALDPETPLTAFRGDIVALIMDEAPLGGCGLIVHRTDRLQVGDFCVVQVGRLLPVAAEVRWRREIGEGIVKIGLRFLADERGE